MIRIGTAGWSIPRASAGAFPEQGTGLERYASRLNVVEVNSSFYRHHAFKTWQRWAGSTPPGFRFAVKLPKEATHVRRLVDCADVIDRFFGEVAGLGDKLGPVLVQLPPNLAFDQKLFAKFVRTLRKASKAALALEPRHASWADAEPLLKKLKVARVAADPPRFSADAEPGGWNGLRYWRLHGSPQIYRSSYADRLPGIAAKLADGKAETWCIFDNTMTGAAMADALDLSEIDQGGRLSQSLRKGE